MDASPDVLAETVRAKRVAIDNNLALLRVKLSKADEIEINFTSAHQRNVRFAANQMSTAGGITSPIPVHARSCTDSS